MQKKPHRRNPIIIQTELGTEKQCIACNEFFPLDKEFWWHNGYTKRNGEKSWCAACKSCYNTYYRRRLNVSRTHGTKSNWERII